MSLRRSLFAVLPLVSSASLIAADLLPFRMPWNDATPGITSLQTWQPAAAGANGWVQVTPAGHYAIGGSPIRFLGVNVGAASAMPTHAHAEAHAARLARFGFNSVRLHHLEAPWDKANVLIDYATGSSRNLSADRLEKLHYFVAQLASKGIYSDVNLLVSREFQAADGLGAEITQLGWKDQHILGFFNDTALALHQEHATKLLTAPNPYRNNVPLGLDPAVAFVEIMNENGLLQKWYEGVLDTMPAVYRGQLQTRWNQWLAQRYANTAALLAGWGAIDQPLGTNLLKNGDFASGMTSWNGEQHDSAVATFTGTTDFNGTAALKINVTQPGTASWHVQVNQSPLTLTANGYYTVSFWAKANSAVPLYAGLARAYGDYGGIGNSVSATLGTTWQQYTVALQVGAAETNARLNFGGFGDRVCTVWLADVRVQPGGKFGGLPAGVTLEAGNVPSVLRNAGGVAYTLSQRQDWTRCLLSLEASYWNAMYQHVKTTLHYPGIVWGTIIANSPPNAQAGLDAIDSHAYWQHPTWPAGQDWDPVTWTIPNTSMVNDATGGTLGGIARQRVKGKPHNVTEYQHPSPNTYTTEGPLLAAAYAALQDWDSLWMFAYETGEAEYVTSFFDHGTHPGRMANNLLAAALFRRGDVAVATNEFTMAFSPDKETEVATAVGGAWNVADGSHLGVPASLALVSRLNLSIGAGATGLTSPPAAPGGSAIASDTSELLWDNSHATKGVVTINTARTKAVVGFTDARNWTLGGVQIAPGTTRQDWSTIGITLLEGTAFDSAAGGRALIVATGDLENTGQIWKDSTRTSIGANWGAAPTLIEVVPATITLPVAAARVTAWALDVRGQRTTALAVADASGQARLTLGGNGTTLWYELSIASLNIAPAITSQPASQTVFAGNSVTFTAAAGGTPAPTYQWRKNGANIPGATSAVYTISSVSAGDAGYYAVMASNAVGSVLSNSAALTVRAVAGDLNGDGKRDILWENPASGAHVVWLMNGMAFSNWADLGSVPIDWRVAAVADFDADGQSDILWENAATGAHVIWLMNGTAFSNWVDLGVIPIDWRVAAVADFNGDGRPDLLWANRASGAHVVWLMNGTTFSSWVDWGVVPTAWQVAAAADFNADGSADILWENTVSGERGLWLMNGTTFAGWYSFGNVPAAWRVASAGDFNGDGKTDILWENTVTGERGLWLMNGTAFASWQSLGIVPTDWRIAR